MAEGSTKEEVSSPSASVALTNANPSYLLKTVLTKCKEEGVTGTAEAILLGLENPASNQILILSFHVQRDHEIHHVFQDIGASHLSGLIDLPDDDGIAEVLLTIVRDQGQRPLCSLAVGLVVTILAVIETLK